MGPFLRWIVWRVRFHKTDETEEGPVVLTLQILDGPIPQPGSHPILLGHRRNHRLDFVITDLGRGAPSPQAVLQEKPVIIVKCYLFQRTRLARPAGLFRQDHVLESVGSLPRPGEFSVFFRKVHLAQRLRPVARLIQQRGKCVLLIGQKVRVRRKVDLAGRVAAHQGRPRRGAHRRGTDCMGENDALPRQAIEVGGLDDGIAGGADRIPPLLVCHDQQDVRTPVFLLYRVVSWPGHNTPIQRTPGGGGTTCRPRGCGFLNVLASSPWRSRNEFASRSA